MLLTVGLLNQFNPVQDYLEQVEKIAWSIQQILILYHQFPKTTDQLFDRMMKVFLIGAVKRAFERGSKFDTMLVIKGEQGIAPFFLEI